MHLEEGNRSRKLIFDCGYIDAQEEYATKMEYFLIGL